MKKFAEFSNFSYHVGGYKISRTGQYYIRFSSQFKETRFADELRKLAEFTLTRAELDAAITELQNIRDSVPQNPPHEDYAWIKGTETTV